MVRCLSANCERVFANLNAMKISVITAVRNDPEGMKKTLETVAQQVCKGMRIEHIIIDGASTDATGQIIDAFVANRSGSATPEYKVVHEPDRGIYDAMNKGKQLATGDFIYFLNAGDKLSSKDVFFGMADCILRTGQSSALYYGQVQITSKYASWLRPPVVTECGQVNITNVRDLPHHQSAFYPSSFYAANQYDVDFIKYGDTDFSIRAIDTLPCFFVPLLITKVTLGGFSTKRHSWAEACALKRDFTRLARKHPRHFCRREAMLRSGAIIGKWFVDQIFGSDVKHLLMKNVRRRLNPRAVEGRNS
jgi:glycosyltransferase involved in cell wall biosynthesis